eukprot:2418463-Prymnesium_polylepis.1
MKQLNNNSVRKIASMLSPQNRKKLTSVSSNLFRALPPPSVVRYQSMVHPHRKRKRVTSPPNTEHAKKLNDLHKKSLSASKAMMLKVHRDNHEFYSKHHPDGPYWKMVQQILSKRGQPWYVKLAAGDPTTHKH